MPISIRARRPPSPRFAGEVSGIDITRPIGREDVAAIEAGMDAYAVLMFRGQELTDAQQLAFEVEDLVSERSPVYSRRAIDFTDHTPEEIATFGSLRQRRAMMHRARRFAWSEVRDVRRTTLAGNVPPAEQEPVA